MTVAELIEILRKKPQESPVYVLDADREGGVFIPLVMAFSADGKTYLVGTSEDVFEDL